jgi:hypothetical protein
MNMLRVEQQAKDKINTADCKSHNLAISKEVVNPSMDCFFFRILYSLYIYSK